jgi:predicted nucleic acid-binding protein
VIVVDSNVIAYCWIASYWTQAAQRVRICDPEWHVPVLWRSEMRSALGVYIGRGAIALDHAAAIMETAEGFLAGYEHQLASRRVLELAASSSLSTYDCEFVVLAEALGVPLVTEDRAVLKAFPESALTMERFLAGFPASATRITPQAHEYSRRSSPRSRPARRTPRDRAD